MTRKTCIVTGAASGIGRELAIRLCERGWHVLAADIDLDGLDSLAGESAWASGGGETAALDVREPERWRELVNRVRESHGRLDALFNVAGVIKPGFVHESEDADVDLHIDINLKGVIHGTRVAGRAMVDQGGGHIVNIGSLASLAPVAGLGLYSASKFGVRGFSLAAAQEMRVHGVCVSVLLPDAVATPMLDRQVEYEEAAMTFSGSRPLTVDQVVDAVIDRVLPDQPVEVTLPVGRGRLAKLSSVLPQVSLWLGPLLARIGTRNQAKYKPTEDE
ncbi:MAG: SDR family oxidoreductase [Myxococcota bacterium]